MECEVPETGKTLDSWALSGRNKTDGGIGPEGSELINEAESSSYSEPDTERAEVAEDKTREIYTNPFSDVE